MNIVERELCIETIFDESDVEHPSLSSGAHIQNLLERVFSDVNNYEENLPQIKWFRWSEESLKFSFFLLCRHRTDVSKFFYEMLSKWLIPGKTLHISLHFSTNFSILHLGSQLYTISEAILCFESEQEIECMLRNFPFIEKEILIGCESFYQAHRILEMLGINLDDQTAYIQQRVAALVRRFPEELDYDIFSQMQYFLVFSSETFRALRSSMHCTRIIYVLYLLRKKILSESENFPEKRHLQLKIRKAYFQSPLGTREVLALFVSINFLNDHEIFEARHLLAALSNYFHDIRCVQDSYFAQENKGDNIHSFYLEIEKNNGELFKKEEILTLKKALSDEIKNRVEQLVSPLFMPRNEEEVMRNILILSQQIKYLKDIPQMIISFDEQRASELCFTVIIVRILLPNSPSLKDLLEENLEDFSVAFDRIKIVGMLRRKYPKEATVLSLSLPVDSFLREDYSVDLYLARHSVLQKLQQSLGEMRDYNGGMMAKQNENYLALKKALGDLAKKYTLILQNFFHSIFPSEYNATADPDSLYKLFKLLIKSLENKENTQDLQIEHEKWSRELFVVLKFQNPVLKEQIFNVLDYLKINNKELISAQLYISDCFYLGFIYLTGDHKKQQLFINAMDL